MGIVRTIVRRRWYEGIALVAVIGAVSAEAPSFSFGGEVSYRMLQIMQDGGLYTRQGIGGIEWGDERQSRKKWDHRVSGEVIITAELGTHFELVGGYRATPEGSGLSECRGRLDWDFPRNILFQVTGGLFRYTYNSDSRNLGEYLLLSGTYPGFVFSGREWNNYLGVLIHAHLFDAVRIDGLITTEMNVPPYYDLSLSCIASFNIAEIATVGTGITGDRLIPVRPGLSTPDPIMVDGVERQYSRRGVKLMGRGSFDVKPLFGSPAVFGENDLRIYAEAAVLGVKNYPVYYEQIAERIPAMAGFNVPAFGLLDYIAVEAEYYGSPHQNNPQKDPTPLPLEEDLGSVDDIKWSVSLKRSLGSSIAAYARIARDHLRFEDASGDVEDWEHIVSPEQWYWSLMLVYSF